jgi:hypothetical protein
MCSTSKLQRCIDTEVSVSSMVAAALSDTVMIETNGGIDL